MLWMMTIYSVRFRLHQQDREAKEHTLSDKLYGTTDLMCPAFSTLHP